jgi:hypothetical protein
MNDYADRNSVGCGLELLWHEYEPNFDLYSKIVYIKSATTADHLCINSRSPLNVCRYSVVSPSSVWANQRTYEQFQGRSAYTHLRRDIFALA